METSEMSNQEQEVCVLDDIYVYLLPTSTCDFR